MPHEVDMTRALILSLTEWWRQQTDPRPVARVVLAVGQFTCVEPDLLRTSFARQRVGTFLEGAELAIKDVPFVAHCRRCDRNYRPDLGQQYACPDCADPLGEIRSGRELKIERIDWAEMEPIDPEPIGERVYA